MSTWTSALRLGSTSYVYPDDVLPNVQRLSGRVQDIEWVVFELTYGLPGPEVVAEMARLGQDYGHSYTVHLPLDLALAAEDEAAHQASVDDARRVIDAAAPLEPWAYIVHLGPAEAAENHQVSDTPTGEFSPWHERAARSLEALAGAAGGYERLAIENIHQYPPSRLLPLLERLPVSLCLDVGHLLRQGRDPLPLLEEHLPRTRSLHLHGCEGGRDHRSLAAMDQGLLLNILRRLRQGRYGGVVTIELFETEPFFDSWDLVEGLWRRVQA